MSGIWHRIRGRRSRPLTCRELVELVTAYLEDELDRDARRRFDEHIHGCDGCTAYLEQMRLTVAVVGRVRPDDLLRRDEGRAASAASAAGPATEQRWTARPQQVSSSSSSRTPRRRQQPPPRFSSRRPRPAARSSSRVARRHVARTSSRRTRTPTGAAPTSGSATTAACRRPTLARTSASSGRRSSTGSIVPADSCTRSPTERAPADAAAAYDAELRGVALDLVLLGLGTDGHTASLFPNAASLDVRDRLAVAAGTWPRPVRRPRDPDDPRAGSRRARRLPRRRRRQGRAGTARFGEPPSRDTPASLVRSRHGTTTVILDERQRPSSPERAAPRCQPLDGLPRSRR